MADDSKSTGPPKRVATAAVDDVNLVLHYIRLNVVSAKGVRNADIGGKSDPFCEAIVNSLVRTTPVIQDNLDPVWNSEFHFFVQDKPAVADFKLYDEDDYGKNDHLGDAQLDLNPLWGATTAEGSTVEKDLPIIYNKSQKGTLHVKAYVRIMKPVKTEKKLEATAKALESTEKNLKEKETLVAATTSKLEETGKVLGQTQEELDAKAKALGQTQAVLGQTQEELDAKAKALGLTREELDAKTKESEEKSLALAKTEDEKKKIAEELKEKYEKMMKLQKQLEENKSDGEDYLKIHLVHVDVISANKLLNADLIGKSDPYVETVVQGLTRSTHVIDDNLDPVWNCKFAFFLQNQPSCVEFHVFDKDDRGKDDSLGDAKLDLEPLFKSGEIFEGPLPVIYKGKQSGRLNIRAYCKIMHPVKTEKKLTETVEQLQETEEKKAKVEAQLGETNAELEKKFHEIRELANGNSQIKKKFDELMEQLTMAEVASKNKTAEVVALERERTELRVTVEELRAKIAQNEEEITRLKAESKKIQEDSEKERKELTNKIHELETSQSKAAAAPVTKADSKAHASEPAKASAAEPAKAPAAATKAPAADAKAPTSDAVVEKKEGKDGKADPRASQITAAATSGKPASEDFLVRVNIVKGIALRNAAWVGQSDPFCQVTVGALTALTKAILNTQDPEWNAKLLFYGEAGTALPRTLTLTVRDENKYTAAGLIGDATVNLTSLWEKGGVFEELVELTFKGRAAGKISLQVTAQGLGTQHKVASGAERQSLFVGAKS